MRLGTPLSHAILFALFALVVPRSNASPSKPGNLQRGPFPFNPGFHIGKVLDLAEVISTHSWEFGTLTEALLELYDPELSVFGNNPFEAAKGLGDGNRERRLPRALVYANETIVIGTGKNALADGDGAVGDPASLGVGAVLLGKLPGFKKFANAAAETVAYVTHDAPRASNGAISHRSEYVELWADFVYMVPPFLAYYAADTSNVALLRESVDQCEKYREILQVKPKARFAGLWHHIQGPQHDDPGLWSTGNAWVASGMSRVLATVLKAPLDEGREVVKWRSQAAANLTTWIKEIIDATIGAGKDSYQNGLVKNYYDKPETFGETSGSTLLAATVYRMAILSPLIFGHDERYIRWADGIRRTLGGEFFDDLSGGKLSHVDGKNGTVRPAVNPLGWGDEKPWLAGSPEGQSFVVLMYAAWRDCVLEHKCRKD